MSGSASTEPSGESQFRRESVGTGPDFRQTQDVLARAVASFRCEVRDGIRYPGYTERPDEGRLEPFSPILTTLAEIYQVTWICEVCLHLFKERSGLSAPDIIAEAIYKEVATLRAAVRGSMTPLNTQATNVKILGHRHAVYTFLRAERPEMPVITNLKYCRNAVRGFWHSTANWIVSLEPHVRQTSDIQRFLNAVQVILMVGPLEFTNLESSTIVALRAYIVANDVPRLSYTSIFSDSQYIEMLDMSRKSRGSVLALADKYEQEAQHRQGGASATLGRHKLLRGAITGRRAAIYGTVASNITVREY